MFDRILNSSHPCVIALDVAHPMQPRCDPDSFGSQDRLDLFHVHAKEVDQRTLGTQELLPDLFDCGSGEGQGSYRTLSRGVQDRYHPPGLLYRGDERYETTLEP